MDVPEEPTAVPALKGAAGTQRNHGAWFYEVYKMLYRKWPVKKMPMSQGLIWIKTMPW